MYFCIEMMEGPVGEDILLGSSTCDVGNFIFINKFITFLYKRAAQNLSGYSQA